MAFPQGIDFRGSAGFVTDPTNCDPQWVSSTTDYPRTTVQGNTVGWEVSFPSGTRDRTTAGDHRLAGVNFKNASGTATYRMDLPATGAYTINLAAGDASSSTANTITLWDGATQFATISGSASNGQFLDATGVLRTSSADWVTNNAALSRTFTTTIFRIVIGGVGTETALSHVFVASAGGGTTITLGQIAGNWTGNAPLVNQKTQSTLAQRAGVWTGTAPGVNQKTAIVLALRAWAWVGFAPSVNQKTQATLGQRAWSWTGFAPGVNQRTQATLSRAAWAWLAHPIGVGGPMLVTLTQTTWFWTAHKLPGYGHTALSQIQGFVSGFIRKFVSGFDESPPSD